MVRQLVSNTNTGINISTVNNESRNGNLNIHDQSGNTTATTMFATSSETFSVSQTPSPCKVDDKEVESPKREEIISGNRDIDVNIFSGIFGEMLCPKFEYSLL